jgi:transposase
MVKGMHARGMKASEIVRATGISRGRVDKWLRLAECPALRHKKVPRPGMAEYLHEELRQLWDQGCHTGKKLLDEIRKLGYIGSLTSLNRFLQPWREEKRAAQRKEAAAAKSKKADSAAAAVRYVSPQEAAAALSKPKALLNERQGKIVDYLKRIPDFATMRHLVLSFRSILCGGRVSSMRCWIAEAEAAGITAISTFVRQLKKDQVAVENAVRHDWSNGPVEGHVNG